MGRFLYSVRILISTLVVSPAIGSPPQLWPLNSLEVAYENSALVDSVLQKHRVTESFFIALGQSSNLMSADFRARGIETIGTLPLSRFEYGIWIQTPDGPKLNPPLSHEKEKLVFDHFRRFLPRLAAYRNREIVVLDYANSGNSLLAFLNYFDRFCLEEFGQRLSVTYYVAARESQVADVRRVLSASHPGTVHPLRPGSHLEHELQHEIYKAYSEFGPFDVWRQTQCKMERSIHYETLVRAVRDFRSYYLQEGRVSEGATSVRRSLWPETYRPAPPPSSNTPEPGSAPLLSLDLSRWNLDPEERIRWEECLQEMRELERRIRRARGHEF